MSSSNIQKILTVQPRKLHFIGLLGVIGLAIIPFVMSESRLFQLTGTLFFAAFVVCWDLVSGYTGKTSFGHSAFLAAGGYTSALLNLNTELSLVATIIIGTLVAGILGLLIGFPTLRITGPYFALVTLIVPLAMIELLAVFSDITGGQSGLTGVDTISSDIAFNYYLALAVFLTVFTIGYVVVKSNAGEIFTALKEDEEVVSTFGINPTKIKLFAFVLSAVLMGFAGAVYVHTIAGGANPANLLVITININILLAAMLGGIGNIVGAAVGGIVFMELSNWLNNLQVSAPVYAAELSDFSFEILYLTIILVVVFVPQGIVPLINAQILKFADSRSREADQEGTKSS